MINVVFVAVTLGLMLLKLTIWLAILRPYSGLSLNVIYCVVTILMLWSYVRAMNSRPVNIKLINHSKQVNRYCERCDAEKAEYVHHCSVCQQCVYRMDHHCPWTGNCVAWSNKKFFLLFLIYTSLSCLLFNFMVVKLVKDTNYNNFNALLWFSRIMSLGIGLLLGGYFAFHVWLLREGKTTLEFLAGKRGELANHTFLYNVTVYFGNNVKSWWVPTTPQLPDALSNKEVEDDDKDTVRFVVI